MEIIWLPEKQGKPSQIYSSGLEFAFINEKNEQCCEFVYCKDFLHDAIYGMLHQKSISIYGFTYNPGNMPHIFLEKTKLAITNARDTKIGDKIETCIDFINQINKILKLKKTTAVHCTNPPKSYKKCGVWVFEGSSRWMQAPTLMSLYTLLLRVGFVHKKDDDCLQTIKAVASGKTKPYQTNDGTYLRSAKSGVDNILKKGYRKIFYGDIRRNYPIVDTGTLHNNFGIVGFTSEYPKTYMPHWYGIKSQKRKKAKVILET